MFMYDRCRLSFRLFHRVVSFIVEQASYHLSGTVAGLHLTPPSSIALFYPPSSVRSSFCNGQGKATSSTPSLFLITCCHALTLLTLLLLFHSSAVSMCVRTCWSAT